ncbi:MAG: SDR family oxidoreductase [Candidatus Bathyarchaeia archaeon]|jgi:UDP-glucose 4-epimerase
MPLDFSEILVTGGAGFIGSHIVDRLISEDTKVRVLDNLSTGEKKNIIQHITKKKCQFIEGDIQDFETVKKATKGVDAVIHQAALVSVTRSVEDPILSNNINVKGSLNLLKAALDQNVKRFVYASSCAVYGDTKKLPNKENTPAKPLSPYAADKLAVEYYAKVFHELYGLETVCLRYFNVYGPRQKPGQYSGVISVFVNNLLKNKAPTIYGDGEQKRDFINVKDIVAANILALTHPSAAGDVFNVSTGQPVTINELVETIQKITATTELKPTYTNPRTGDIKYSYADITKIQKKLGFKPKIGLEEGLTELVNWSKNQ